MFWVVVTGLFLVAAAWIAFPMLSGPRASTSAPSMTGSTEIDLPPTPQPAAVTQSQSGSPAPLPPAATTTHSTTTPSTTAASTLPSAPVASEPAKVAPAQDPAPHAVPAEMQPPAAKPAEAKPSTVTSDSVSATLDSVLAGAGGAGSDAAKPDAAKEAAPKEMPKIETRADGSQKIDDRFIVKGKGTKDEPYVVSWEHLVSIQETFDPSQKKDKIPGRLQYLDGTYVKLIGYAAFPMAVPQPKELLVMLNQWDGCCIGVPPTAYDAVEVHLRTKATQEQRFAVHGAVKGKFQIKPYVTGNWLVGLYLMTDADFEPTMGGTDN